MNHARTLVAGLLASLALALAPSASKGDDAPARPAPSGSWEPILDGQVQPTQAPTPRPPSPTTPPPAAAPATPVPPASSSTAAVTAPPGTANPLAAPPSNLGSADPDNPFAGLATNTTGDAGAAGAQPQGPRVGLFQMIGDQSPLLTLRAAATTTGTGTGTGAGPVVPPPFPPKTPPATPSPRQATALAPSVRGFKISENQSPLPQDRIFYTFNYYYNLNSAVDKRFDTPINNLRAYREILGFEKTFDQGRASFGIRMPLDTLYASSTIQGNFAKPGGTSTSLGDLSLFTKFLVRQDPNTGNTISAGLVVTAPTGPRTFAGANYIQSIHTTTLQPFVGYLFTKGRFYLHGFSAFEFPVDPADATLAYNDVGLGYYLYKNMEEQPTRRVTAIVPTTEVHINTPLNHRNPFNQADVAASANVVNLTQGLSVEFNRRSILTIGIVTPVTYPKPFDLEALVLFNIRFGGSRRNPPPVLGG